MARLVLTDRFSIDMLPNESCMIEFIRASLEEARKLVEVARRRGARIVSIVGRPEVAELVKELLAGIEVELQQADGYVMGGSDVLLIIDRKPGEKEPRILVAYRAEPADDQSVAPYSPEVEEILAEVYPWIGSDDVEWEEECGIDEEEEDW